MADTITLDRAGLCEAVATQVMKWTPKVQHTEWFGDAPQYYDAANIYMCECARWNPLENPAHIMMVVRWMEGNDCLLSEIGESDHWDIGFLVYDDMIIDAQHQSREAAICLAALEVMTGNPYALKEE